MTGLGDFQHSGYTVEGNIEREVALFAGVHRRFGWRRFLLVVVAVLVLAPLAIGFLNLVLP